MPAYLTSTVTMRANRSSPDKRFPSVEDDSERTGKAVLLSTEALRNRRFAHRRPLLSRGPLAM